MNRCSKHRKDLALFAAGVLEGAERSALLSHVASCAACRSHLQALSEISRQHSNLVDSMPPAELSEDWHRRFRQRIQVLESEPPNGSTSRIPPALRIFRWPLAIPSAAFAVVAVVALLLLTRPSPDPGSGRLTSQTNPSLPAKNTSSNFTPTLLAFQRALRDSPESLDALLDQQAEGPGQPSLRITAVSRDSGLLTE